MPAAFAMTMLINPLPACGFFSYYAGEVLGPVGYASPDNKWEENLLPRIPQELRPVDPLAGAGEKDQPHQIADVVVKTGGRGPAARVHGEREINPGRLRVHV